MLHYLKSRLCGASKHSDHSFSKINSFDMPLKTLSRRNFLGSAVSSTSILALTGCNLIFGPTLEKLNPGATILAVGDSITAGFGASEENSYPSKLSKISGFKVVNAGAYGATTENCLESLPEKLALHSPSLVLVCIGGNDFLRNISLSEVRDHLRNIVITAKEQAQVVLISQPSPKGVKAAAGILSDHPLYEEVAASCSVPLCSQICADVLSDKELKSDPIHPNDKGYDFLAVKIDEFLRKKGAY